MAAGVERPKHYSGACQRIEGARCCGQRTRRLHGNRSRSLRDAFGGAVARARSRQTTLGGDQDALLFLAPAAFLLAPQFSAKLPSPAYNQSRKCPLHSTKSSARRASVSRKLVFTPTFAICCVVPSSTNHADLRARFVMPRSSALASSPS